MKALLQRVTHASVSVEGVMQGEIGAGLLVLLGIAKSDDASHAQRLADKLMRYRVFSDDNGRMNLSVLDANADLLVVSQFTLVADTTKGTRPGFSSAAEPEEAKRLYEVFVGCCHDKISRVETGQFGADMQVSLLNDGPVTFMLEV